VDAGAEPVGTIEVALGHATRLLGREPKLAAEQATEILKVVPGHPRALLLLGAARRLEGRAAEALAILEPLARTQPQAAAVHYEYGLTLGAVRRGEDAVGALHRAVALNPELPGAWLALADHLAAIGDVAGADAAYARHIKASTRDPRLLAPAAALVENDIPRAEALLRAHLHENPTDVAAIRMLAEVAARLGRYIDAENLLARCIELAPSFVPARVQYATVLNRQNRASEALEQIEPLLAAEPANPNYRALKATFLVGIGEYAQATDLYTGILAEYPNQARVWVMLGHVLKTAARQEEAIRAYRKALELSPDMGEAWWSLANLKTIRFEGRDVDAMRAQLAREQISVENRLHLHFALGKAYEDEARYSESFQHYAEGNRLRRGQVNYNADDNSEFVQRSRALYTRDFFRAREGTGCAAPDPIFVVGLPRAGSTLVEQILSSHSLVEGTMELHDMIALARGLEGRGQHGRAVQYLEVLGTLDAERLRALGEQYLQRTRIQRKSSAPFFIDKMPNNFRHVGLIHLILPNAKIIDARRHPLGSCFSAFKQHFARGQYFTYDLEDIGRYYHDYVELMAHFDTVLPGRVHRVHYEAMVEDTETEVRKLLEYCGLPFEPECLRFYENTRAVRTASSEQVRRPIFREGLDQWRHYGQWLEPLEKALGPVLPAYPQVPSFADRRYQHNGETSCSVADRENLPRREHDRGPAAETTSR
jgi:tetratricopeptide (TPR) repeat protein